MIHSKRQYKHAVRRLQRANNNIQNDKFVNSLLSSGPNSNIFQAIKKFRGSSRSFSNRVDEQVGSQNIAGRFADIYSELYNKHSSDHELDDIEVDIGNKIRDIDLVDVDRITVDTVNRALKQLKAGKGDVIQSDCFNNGPPALATHLTSLLKAFIIHGRVPYFLLVCTLLPLVKDNLADITSSENYRAIASGSLLLKLLDTMIIILEGEKLSCDKL